MNGLFFARCLKGTRLGLFAVALDRGAGAGSLELIATVVVAELHDHNITFFQLFGDSIPESLSEKCPAAATAEGFVVNFERCGIKKSRQGGSPALLPLGIVLYRRVPDQPEGGRLVHVGEEQRS